MRSKECRNLIVWFLYSGVEIMLSASLLLHAIGENNIIWQEKCVVEYMHCIHEVIAGTRLLQKS